MPFCSANNALQIFAVVQLQKYRPWRFITIKIYYFKNQIFKIINFRKKNVRTKIGDMFVTDSWTDGGRENGYLSRTMDGQMGQEV